MRVQFVLFIRFFMCQYIFWAYRPRKKSLTSAKRRGFERHFFGDRRPGRWIFAVAWWVSGVTREPAEVRNRQPKKSPYTTIIIIRRRGRNGEAGVGPAGRVHHAWSLHAIRARRYRDGGPSAARSRVRVRHGRARVSNGSVSQPRAPRTRSTPSSP